MYILWSHEEIISNDMKNANLKKQDCKTIFTVEFQLCLKVNMHKKDYKEIHQNTDNDYYTLVMRLWMIF